MKRYLTLCITLSLVGLSSFPQSPGVRNGHAMVYYPAFKAIVLFGGADQEKVYGDTWTYKANRWVKMVDNGNSPSARTFPCLAASDQYILLFGGNAVLFGNEKNPTKYLDDTWKFEKGKWSEVKSTSHPDSRAEAPMAYDKVRNRFVLFGGRRSGENWLAGDTWEFDGKSWTRIDTSGPTPRSGAVMVYDENIHEVVLFGGNPIITKEKNYNGATWAWNGSRWELISSKTPLIFNTCMAFDADEKLIVRFGGWNGTARVNDTWVLKNREWERLNLQVAPPARNHSVMVYDPELKSCLLFGGHDGDNVFGDMWKFKSGKWTVVYSVPPIRRVDNGH